MKNTTVKLLTIIIVFLLASVFFWQLFTDRFLYPSRAGASVARVFFEKDLIHAEPGDEVPICVMLLTDMKHSVTGATIEVNYSTESLEFVEKEADYVDATCKSNNYIFSTQARVKHDAKSGTVSISRLSNTGTTASGLFGWGTLVFRLKAGKGKVSLVKEGIQIVGPENTFEPKLGSGSEVLIAAKGTPVVTGAVCALRSKGDCNCDDNIDLLDFKTWLREFKKEADTAVCDLNQDKKVDFQDFYIWWRGFFKVVVE